jgi:ABC-type phosphate transport system substrate-binding protein
MRTKSLCQMRLVGALAALLPALAAATAEAADCTTLPKPVFVAGSSAVKPFLAGVAAELSALTEPVTVVYINGKGSCDGVNYMVPATTTLATGTVSIWSKDTAGKPVEASGGCDLPTAGITVDIGVSDVFATTCPNVTGLPATVKDFLGPIQTMTFSVAKKSTQPAISAEAAYLTFGLGATGETPWTDPTKFFIRPSSSGTLQMLATAINVPAAKWQGNRFKPDGTTSSGSGDVLNYLIALQNTGTQGDADLGIGILATDLIDKNRATIRALPYQHYGQTCGYLPDSTDTSADKQNVRDGHYMVWGPLHMITPVTVGQPSNAGAKVVIDYLTGAVVPAFDLIDTEAKLGVVPDCAMRVSRDSEVGPLSSYMPAKSCQCKFVAAATGTAVPDGCAACLTNDDCTAAAPACNYGYCEVR